MKKTLTILICLTLVIACVVPVCAFAEGTTPPAVEHDSVHFINPTAITVVGNYLYVADVVEDGRSAILCFVTGGDNPSLKYTYDGIDGVVTGLSSNNKDVLYLNMSNKVVELNLNEDALPTVGKTYSMPQSATNIVDVAYGKIANIESKTVYALTESALYQYNNDQFIELFNSLSAAKAVLSMDEAPNYQLYYLNGEGSAICNRMTLYNGAQDSAFANKLALTSGFVPTGMLRINDDVALYNNKDICVIEETTSAASTTRLLTLSSLYANDCNICDVEACGDRLFILNSKNQIDIFDKTEGVYNNLPTTTIGSDMVDKAVPTSYTSFTLARPNGYPTNIVYKTNADSSIVDIITDASEYIILGYDGDNTSHYYYVMVGDKFGWVKKSDGTLTTPASDSKITIVDNTYGDIIFGYEAKFTSLNGVYVYDLPLSTAHQTEVTQTATTMKTVKVLQKFTEGNQVWYYVSYDEGKTGFVKESDVGQFHITSKVESVPTQGLKKINSSLFSAVNLYATAELNEDEAVADENGNVIKLYSGDRVTLVTTKGESSFIMILHNDGTKDFGWVESSRLIDVHQITTNAIVGLSLLGFAVALAAILVVVYFKRKKRIKANRD